MSECYRKTSKLNCSFWTFLDFFAVIVAAGGVLGGVCSLALSRWSQCGGQGQSRRSYTKPARFTVSAAAERC